MNDIIYVFGGEIMFGIKAGASLGRGLAVLAYIVALSCIVLEIPADNRSGLCLLLPPPPAPTPLTSLCLCVHLFAPVLSATGESHQTCCSFMYYTVCSSVCCRKLLVNHQENKQTKTTTHKSQVQ